MTLKITRTSPVRRWRSCMKIWYECNFSVNLPDSVAPGPEPFLPFVQAEVWDLEVLRSNNSSWPINVADVKEGLITVKGHMQVRVGRKRRGPFDASDPSRRRRSYRVTTETYSCSGSAKAPCLQTALCWPPPATTGTSSSGRCISKRVRISPGRGGGAWTWLLPCSVSNSSVCLVVSGRPSVPPRCLHELRPHGGRPLSCLLFCDNHKRQDPE